MIFGDDSIALEITLRLRTLQGALQPLHTPEGLGRLREYDLCTNYSTQSIKHETCQTLGLPRALLLTVAGVVIMIRVLRHEVHTPHFLELLVKVVLSVALYYAFNNRTS